jgi:uncharacterized membrane protein YsdA (DUF1294 family)/cold shock CspA family protein
MRAAAFFINRMNRTALSTPRSHSRMRFDGTLKSWNDERGLGLLAADQGGQDIVVQLEALAPVAGKPSVGQRFSFEVEPALGGIKRAKNLAQAPRGAGNRQMRQRQRDRAGEVGLRCLLVIPAFALTFLAAAVFWRIDLWVAAHYLIASLVTAIAYASDKTAAVEGRLRTSEFTLLMLGFVGGWPGAVLAQQMLRHKIRKASFQTLFWLTVLVNVMAFLWLASPLGGGLMH